MLLEIYILMQVAAFVLFVTAFFTRQEILWVVTMFLSGVLMLAGSTIEIAHYVFNSTSGGYGFTTSVLYYPYLMGINMLFFALALVFGIFDIWDKFGNKVAGNL